MGSDYPNTDRSRDPNTDRSRDPNTDRSRDPNTDRSRDPNTDRCRDPNTDRSHDPNTDRSRGPREAMCRVISCWVFPTMMARDLCSRVTRISTVAEQQYLAISIRSAKNWGGRRNRIYSNDRYSARNIPYATGG